MKRLVVLLVLAAFGLCEEAQAARSSRMYRYLDAQGKWVYVVSYDDVPEQFRKSASAVVITEKEAEPQEETAAADTGDAVRAVGQLSFSSNGNGNGKGRVTGEAKNFHSAKVTGAKLIVQVVTAEGTELPSASFPLAGKGGEGILEPGESVRVNATLGVAAAIIKGFSYSFTWEKSGAAPPPPPPANNGQKQ